MKAVDSTGAGDAFLGGLLAALHHGASRIVGVEINRSTLEMVRGPFRDFLGAPYARPEVQHLLKPLVVSWGYEAERPSGSAFVRRNAIVCGWQRSETKKHFPSAPLSNTRAHSVIASAAAVHTRREIAAIQDKKERARVEREHTGRWVSIAPGVWRHSGTPDTWELQLAAGLAQLLPGVSVSLSCRVSPLIGTNFARRRIWLKRFRKSTPICPPNGATSNPTRSSSSRCRSTACA